MLALLDAVALALFAGPTIARAHDTRADQHVTNDWIEGLKNSSGEMCCGDNDCRPLSPTMLKIRDGQIHVLLGGEWFAVPEEAILDSTSPDGQPWACPRVEPSISGGYAYVTSGVRCLLLPALSGLHLPAHHKADAPAPPVTRLN